jgi:hypothetical protein
VNSGFERRLLIVWLALSTITCVSLWLGSLHHHDAFKPNAAITFSVIVIALVKVRVIVREFMEVRNAPNLLRRLTDMWLGLTGVSLLGTYFVGMAFSTR